MVKSKIREVGDIIDLHFIKPYNDYHMVGLRGVARYPVLYKILDQPSVVGAWEVDRCWDEGYYGHEVEYSYLMGTLLRKIPRYNYQMYIFKEESERW